LPQTAKSGVPGDLEKFDVDRQRNQKYERPEGNPTAMNYAANDAPTKSRRHPDRSLAHVRRKTSRDLHFRASTNGPNLRLTARIALSVDGKLIASAVNTHILVI